MTNPVIKRLALLGYAAMLLHCGGSERFIAKTPPPSDKNPAPQPQHRSINAYGEYFSRQVTGQVDQFFDLSRNIRILSGNRREALNTDPFGEVYNSSWYTNRHHLHPMDDSTFARGPNRGSGPQKGPWTVVSAKNEGVTPGFVISDRAGDRYVIKFDPLANPELASGAEVVSTKLYYAMGYNTPENYVTHFRPQDLLLGDKVKFTDSTGQKRVMQEKDLQQIVKRLRVENNGKIRALASKFLSGVPVGPFRYSGTREDDPNDYIRHEHRRELRGLRIITAWLNHFDTKDGNTLDMYVTENGRSFVRHYLIDFGATLGSSTDAANESWRGHENDVDPGETVRNLVKLGLSVHPWERELENYGPFPSVGYYEAENFDPIRYKPQVPNPAFENMTWHDGYWAAKVITAINDRQIKLAVRQGQYSNPQAAAYLAETIARRRDKIGRYFFEKVLPLDHFRIKDNAGGSQQLVFDDLAVLRGYATDKDRQFTASFFIGDKLLGNPATAGDETTIDLPKTTSVLTNADDQLKLRLQLSSHPNQFIDIYFDNQSRDEGFRLLGIRRSS